MGNQAKVTPMMFIVIGAALSLLVFFVYRSVFSFDSLEEKIQDPTFMNQDVKETSHGAEKEDGRLGSKSSAQKEEERPENKSGADKEVSKKENQVKCDFNQWTINKEKTDKLVNDKSLDDDAYYKAIYDEQKRVCGPLCTFNDDSKIHHYPDEKKLLNHHLRTKITCCNLFTTPIFDEPAVRWPITSIPKAMEKDFTLNGKYKVGIDMRHERVSGLSVTVSGDVTTTLTPKWSKNEIQHYVDTAKAGIEKDNIYNAQPIVLEAIKYADFAGKHILVVGSQVPWVEGALLAAGVKKITTLEYMKIKTDHPQVETIMPLEFNEKYSRGELHNAFDGAITYSSIEHSGLGRYGDLMNPWGDVIAIAKVWCTIKDGGMIAVGVPDENTDLIMFNVHRLYGLDRWALIFQNWEVVHKIPGPRATVPIQPIMIAKKREFA